MVIWKVRILTLISEFLDLEEVLGVVTDVDKVAFAVVFWREEELDEHGLSSFALHVHPDVECLVVQAGVLSKNRNLVGSLFAWIIEGYIAK